MSSMQFRQFAINPIGKGPVRIIHLNNLVSLLLTLIYIEFGINWPCIFFQKKIVNFSKSISANMFLSPLSKVRGPSFEQTFISFTQECFLQDWLKLSWRFLARRLDFVNTFSVFQYHLLLEKDVPRFIWTLLNSLYPTMLCVKFC